MREKIIAVITVPQIRDGMAMLLQAACNSGRNRDLLRHDLQCVHCRSCVASLLDPAYSNAAFYALPDQPVHQFLNSCHCVRMNSCWLGLSASVALKWWVYSGLPSSTIRYL